MLVAMVVIFGACWLPLNALNILRDAGLLSHMPLLTHSFTSVFLTTHLLAMSGAIMRMGR